MALIFQSIVLDLLTFFVVLSGALYLYFTRHFNYWKKRNVPYVKPVPFFGSFKDIVLKKTSLALKLRDLYLENKGKPVIGAFAFDTPILVIRDVQLVKNILVKDFQYFPDRHFEPNEKLDPLTHKSLFGLRGQRWKHLRAKLAPTFTSGKMKKMFYLVDECGVEVAKHLSTCAATGKPIPVRETMARFTTDVFSTCAFGIDTKCIHNPKAEFRQIMKRFFELTPFELIKLTSAFFAPGILRALNLRVFDVKVENYARKVIWDVVNHRQENGIVRNDLLDLMIELKNKGKIQGEPSDASSKEPEDPNEVFEMEGDNFIAQPFIFLVAGFETSSTTISFTLYELALQPKCQDRLRAEMRAVLAKHDGKVTYEAMQDMNYLDMVVSETLRKYPPLSFLDRRCVKDYKVPDADFTVEKDTCVLITILGLHMDPEFFPDPNKYDPERFTEECKSSRPKFAYVAFGDGPRNCIGMRFGMMQTKVGLIHILNRFEVSPCKETPVPMQFNQNTIMVMAKGDLPLIFKEL